MRRVLLSRPTASLAVPSGQSVHRAWSRGSAPESWYDQAAVSGQHLQSLVLSKTCTAKVFLLALLDFHWTPWSSWFSTVKSRLPWTASALEYTCGGGRWMHDGTAFAARSRSCRVALDLDLKLRWLNRHNSRAHNREPWKRATPAPPPWLPRAATSLQHVEPVATCRARLVPRTHGRRTIVDGCREDKLRIVARTIADHFIKQDDGCLVPMLPWDVSYKSCV